MIAQPSLCDTVLTSPSVWSLPNDFLVFLFTGFHQLVHQCESSVWEFERERSTAERHQNGSENSPKQVGVFAVLGLSQEVFPRTSQCPLHPHDSREKDVNFASFDLLNRSGMQGNHLCQPFLRDRLTDALPAHIRPEDFQLRRLKTVRWHALLRRYERLLEHTTMGREI